MSKTRKAPTVLGKLIPTNRSFPKITPWGASHKYVLIKGRFAQEWLHLWALCTTLVKNGALCAKSSRKNHS